MVYGDTAVQRYHPIRTNLVVLFALKCTIVCQPMSFPARLGDVVKWRS